MEYKSKGGGGTGNFKVKNAYYFYKSIIFMIDFKGSNLKQKKKDQEYEQILINFIVFHRLKSINLFFKYTFNGLKKWFTRLQLKISITVLSTCNSTWQYSLFLLLYIFMILQYQFLTS